MLADSKTGAFETPQARSISPPFPQSANPLHLSRLLRRGCAGSGLSASLAAACPVLRAAEVPPRDQGVNCGEVLRTLFVRTRSTRTRAVKFIERGGDGAAPARQGGRDVNEGWPASGLGARPRRGAQPGGSQMGDGAAHELRLRRRRCYPRESGCGGIHVAFSRFCHTWGCRC